MVSYGQFIGLDPPLRADVFERLRAVAMIDEFFTSSDGEIERRTTMSPKFLEAMRGNPHYQAMRDAIRSAAITVCGDAQDMTKFAEAVQGRVAQKMFLIGLTAKGEREQIVALTHLADRASPKRSRKELPPQAISFPDKVLETIQMALQAGLKYGAEGAAVRIDAARLNVPEIKRLNPAPDDASS